uniref:Superoxide dismutase [Cu-Zn] n=1 Tax=Urechis unicinctus TaxID=6432 RepID=A0A1W6SA21_UREUN|nr:superoxide dismutase [Urechis unicinctus]
MEGVPPRTTLLVALGVCLISGTTGEVIQATCAVEVNSATEPAERQNVTGSVVLQQDEEDGNTVLTLSLSGFNTTDGNNEHGFHVHSNGDLSNGCQSTGSHYNPTNFNHSGPTDNYRHVGDLGNIMEDANGAVSTSINDSVVSLRGTYSVIGRALVIHAMRDDLGKGNDTGSITTGNAGARLACCVIEASKAGLSTHYTHLSLLLACLALTWLPLTRHSGNI